MRRRECIGSQAQLVLKPIVQRAGSLHHAQLRNSLPAFSFPWMHFGRDR
jgi:hypothetical protein